MCSVLGYLFAIFLFIYRALHYAMKISVLGNGLQRDKKGNIFMLIINQPCCHDCQMMFDDPDDIPLGTLTGLCCKPLHFETGLLGKDPSRTFPGSGVFNHVQIGPKKKISFTRYLFTDFIR